MNGNAGATRIAVNTLPFWSRGAVDFDLRWDGVNPSRIVIPRGQRIPLFDYKQNTRQVTALQGQESTQRDTILTKDGQTRGGAKYVFHGMSYTFDGAPYEVRDPNGQQTQTDFAIFPPTSQPPAIPGIESPPSVEDYRGLASALLTAILQSFTVITQIDGTKRTLEMGPLILWPGVGGADDTVQSTNGGSFVQNYLAFPETISWNPSGATDSNLVVNLQAAYNVIMPEFVTPDGLNPFVDPPAPYDPPAAPSSLGRKWRQAFVLNLHGQEIGPVSNIS